MKKNNIILLVLFAVLAAATVYFIKNKNGKNTFIAPDQDFAVPADQVGKIFIADRNKKQVTITLKGKQWFVNDKYRAKKDVIDNCLQGISGVKVKYIPTQGAIQNAIKELATNGIKVEVYSKSNEKLKTYYIGSTDTDGSGTYYIMEGAEKPYVMHIPYFYGEIQPRFPLTINDWRDRTIFEEDIDNIETASVEYPDQKSASFRVDNNAGVFEVKPFYTGVPQKTGQKKGIAENFLFGFKSIVAEAVENSSSIRDSLIATQPFTVISLKNKTGEENAVRLYPIYAKDENGNMKIGMKPDRYYAYSNKGDFFLVQDVVFRKLFWDYQAFF
jgi:hypothetical protein